MERRLWGSAGPPRSVRPFRMLLWALLLIASLRVNTEAWVMVLITSIPPLSSSPPGTSKPKVQNPSKVPFNYSSAPWSCCKMPSSYPNRPEAASLRKFLQNPLTQKQGVLPQNSRHALVPALVWSWAPGLCFWWLYALLGGRCSPPGGAAPWPTCLEMPSYGALSRTGASYTLPESRMTL